MTNQREDKRKKLLSELIIFANKSETFNPHFYKSAMIEILGWSEKEFNIEQRRLGDRYCHFVDVIDDHDRYAINISVCLELQEKYNQETISQNRHNQLIRIAILVAILGAAIGFGLTKIF